MLETCRREFSRAARAGESVSILSIDVDHFKKYNDNHGHDAGDMVLRAVGQCLDGLFPSVRIPVSGMPPLGRSYSICWSSSPQRPPADVLDRSNSASELLRDMQQQGRRNVKLLP